MRSLNDILGEVPIVKLPRTDQLKGCAYKSYLSSFDLTQFFYGIKIAQESKQYCNFYYDGAVYTHSALPMGLKSSPFWAQSVSERIFSNKNLVKYCEQKNIIMGSAQFPFTNVSQFRIIYVDDLLLHTLKELGILAHLAVIDFILWAVEISGVKLSRKKAKILQPVIKWLGHQYDSDQDLAGIPDERQNTFEKLRHPRSIAELNLLLGGFQYFQTYLPGF